MDPLIFTHYLILLYFILIFNTNLMIILCSGRTDGESNTSAQIGIVETSHYGSILQLRRESGYSESQDEKRKMPLGTLIRRNPCASQRASDEKSWGNSAETVRRSIARAETEPGRWLLGHLVPRERELPGSPRKRKWNWTRKPNSRFGTRLVGSSYTPPPSSSLSPPPKSCP